MTSAPEGCLIIPSLLPGFIQQEMTSAIALSGREVIVFRGHITDGAMDKTCACGCGMHANGDTTVTLRHLPYGGHLSAIVVSRPQLRCPRCSATRVPKIAFKEPGHMLTTALADYARSLLSTGDYTLREVGFICGIGKNTVKDIDMARLKEIHTEDRGTRLKPPEHQARYLGIDEFKLHDGHRYATHVMDLERGDVLWVAHGKKKQVVYDFVEHVGQAWMANVEAVACDMNSDFYEGFQECCPHLAIVFDHFHIVKNFNEKVVSAVRKDEQARLKESGDEVAAKSLKGSKYVLSAKRSTLAEKDARAASGELVRKGSALFGTEDVACKGGWTERYEAHMTDDLSRRK